MSPLHPCTSSTQPPTHPRGLSKSVQQMMLLVLLAETPLFYPWTCGSKAKRREREHTAVRRRKKLFLCLTGETPFLLCNWQRWKAHGDGGSRPDVLKKRKRALMTLPSAFWKQRTSLWHGKPFEDTNKKHIQEIL